MITRYTTVKALGDGSAYLTLFLCTAFWIEFGLHFVPGFPLLELTGFQVFKIIGVAVLLAVVALILRSRICKLALPFALSMFFFTIYVMGS